MPCGLSQRILVLDANLAKHVRVLSDVLELLVLVSLLLARLLFLKLGSLQELCTSAKTATFYTACLQSYNREPGGDTLMSAFNACNVHICALGYN